MEKTGSKAYVRRSFEASIMLLNKFISLRTYSDCRELMETVTVRIMVRNGEF